jgi:hypothetical protein
LECVRTGVWRGEAETRAPEVPLKPGVVIQFRGDVARRWKLGEATLMMHVDGEARAFEAGWFEDKVRFHDVKVAEAADGWVSLPLPAEVVRRMSGQLDPAVVVRGKSGRVNTRASGQFAPQLIVKASR